MGEKKKNTDSEYLRSRMRSLGIADADGIDDIWHDLKSNDSDAKNKPQKNISNVQKKAQQARALIRSKSPTAQAFYHNIASRLKDRTSAAIQALPKNTRTHVAVRIIGLLVVFLGLATVFAVLGTGSNETDKAVLSVQEELNENPTRSQNEPVPLEKPADFTLLLPSGVALDQLDVGRVSPPDAELPAFAYIHELGESKLNITQQLVDNDFNIKTVATAYNATDTISVDGAVLYHGYAEDGVQSVIFQKEQVLVLIRSSRLLSDEVWASFYTELK